MLLALMSLVILDDIGSAKSDLGIDDEEKNHKVKTEQLVERTSQQQSEIMYICQLHEYLL